MTTFKTALVAALVVALTSTLAAAPKPPTLVGKEDKTSMPRQHAQALAHKFSFLEDGKQVRRFARLGYIIKLRANKNYGIDKKVSFPYVRPAVKLFVERLAQQYAAACGEKLTVTSAMRPLNKQPPNASPLSVHPTGMAVDFRVGGEACQKWLATTLLVLEGRGVLEATQERRPAHFHVAVYPRQYTCYVWHKTNRGKCPK